MSKKPNLPTQVHDHFRKANVLHTYVEKDLGEARNHALECGQELLAAKQTIPHGSWETECDRLFDGSARTAQFYMSFARDFGKLKSATQSALLMLEGTLVGAAKAAKEAAKPKTKAESGKPKAETQPETIQPNGTPSPCPDCGGDDFFDDGTCRACPREDAPEVIDTDSEPVDYGQCPNCAGTKWDDGHLGIVCDRCGQPYGEPAGDDGDDVPAEEPEAEESAGTWLRGRLTATLDDLRLYYPDSERSLAACVWESVFADWK